MRLDEMIIKANEDGKTYVNLQDEVTYSATNGFNGEDTDSLWNDGWEELPKRHLTVAEAEKELDCVIDVTDISKLFISSDILPEDGLKIIIFSKSRRACDSGFYDAADKTWKRDHYGALTVKPAFYMKQADLIKLLPKE